MRLLSKDGIDEDLKKKKKKKKKKLLCAGLGDGGHDVGLLCSAGAEVRYGSQGGQA